MKKRVISLIIVATMLVSVSGCGAKSPETVSSVSEVTVSESVLEQSEQTEETKPTKISDFYNYAAGDWMASAETTQRQPYVSYDDEVDLLVKNQLIDLFSGKNSEDFSNNPGLQKLVIFSEQLRDEEKVNKGIERIQEMYGTIDSIKNINELFKLVETPDYCGNPFFVRDYEYTTDCDYRLSFRMYPYASVYDLTEEEEAFLQKEFARQFVLIGEDEEAALEKAALAVKFNHVILDFYNSSLGNFAFWEEEDYVASDHKAPLISMMKELEYYNTDLLGQKYYSFFIYDGVLDFYDNMLSEEFLPALKAFWEVDLFESFYECGSDEMIESCYRLTAGLAGSDLDAIDDIDYSFIKTDKETYSYVIPISVDYGHFAKEYRDAYLTEDVRAEIEEMTRIAKEKYIEILNEYDWLSQRVREKLILKIKKIDINLGEYVDYPSYDEVIIADNPVDTLMAFRAANRQFNKRHLISKEGLPSDTMDLFPSNGWFSPNSNSVLLTLGTIKTLAENKDASYEAKLGLFGSTLTHEIAHALAPNYIQYGVTGVYMDFITEEEDQIIWDRYDDFAEIINEIETENGNLTNGYRCCNEFFTDILSVNCMLRILEDMDNPNYDDFFVNYALSYATKTTPRSEDVLYRNGTHLLGKERVNLALYQFDKLYEVYDIDESDAFYVKPENRVTGY